MDWITGIQRAIDCTETLLTDEIDYESAAKAAYISSFHFQSVFGIFCGDYICIRRLSLAVEKLF